MSETVWSCPTCGTHLDRRDYLTGEQQILSVAPDWEALLGFILAGAEGDDA